MEEIDCTKELEFYPEVLTNPLMQTRRQGSEEVNNTVKYSISDFIVTLQSCKLRTIIKNFQTFILLRGRHPERTPIYWFTRPVPTTAGAGPRPKLGASNSLLVSHGV